MKSIDVNLAVWKWEGIVLAGGTSADFKAFAKRHIDADIETGAHAAGHAYVEYGKPWLLWVESLSDLPSLAHEALHVAAGVLEGRGCEYNKGSEEAFTYTMEHIIRATLAAKKWQKVVA